MRLKTILRFIKIYPSVIFLLFGASILGAGYFFSQKRKIEYVEKKVQPMEIIPPNEIWGNSFKIKRIVGKRWSNGEIVRYHLQISGERRYEIGMKIISYHKCDKFMYSSYDDKYVIIEIAPRAIMCMVDYVRTLE